MDLSQIIANGFHKTFTGSDVTITEAKMKACEEFLIKGQAVTKRKQAVLFGQFPPVDGITNAASTSIDTGVYAQDNIELFCRVKAITGSFYLMQSRQTTSSINYGLSGGQANNDINAFGLTSDITRTADHIYTIKATIVNMAVTLYVKDETTGTEDTKTGTVSATVYPFPSPTTIKLFGDASKLNSGCTVYRAYIKVNGQMAWDMYPCVDVNNSNAPVAYDDVTHAASTVVSGSITAGDLIQPISYAQTDGTACADTDLLLNGSEKWTLKFASLKGTLTTPVAGSLNGGTTWSSRNNFSVTYLNSGWAVYVNGNAGSADRGWSGGNISDQKWHTLEYLGDVNTAPKIDGVAMTGGSGTRIAVTPSVPWRLFGRATTEKGQGTKSQDGVAIARFTGDTWDYIPVRIGQTVEFLDLVSWTFATRTGTLTAGADIPYEQLCPSIIETNVGDALYGQWGKNLWKLDDATDGYYYDSNGVLTATNDSRLTDYLPIEANTKYTLSATIASGSPNKRVNYFDENKNWLSQSVSTSRSFTVTTPNGAKYIRISANYKGSGYIDYSTAMLNEGDTALPYEPYHFGLHPSGEQKAFMGEQGVVDLGTLTWSRGGSLETGEYGFITDIQDKANGTTNMHCDGFRTNPSSWATASDGDYWGNATSNRVYFKDTRFTDAASFKSAMSGKYLFYQRSTDPSFIPPQTRTITTFLPSANSFIDAQKAANNVECDWKFLVLTGQETGWGKQSGVSVFTYALPGRPSAGSSDAFCSGYNIATSYTQVTSTNGTFYFGSYSSAPGVSYWHDDRFTTVEEWKAHVAHALADGHPYIVYFPLATPEVTTVAINPVSLANGTNRVTASSGTVKVTANVRVI